MSKAGRPGQSPWRPSTLRLDMSNQPYPGSRHRQELTSRCDPNLGTDAILPASPLCGRLPSLLHRSALDPGDHGTGSTEDAQRNDDEPDELPDGTRGKPQQGNSKCCLRPRDGRYCDSGATVENDEELGEVGVVKAQTVSTELELADENGG